MNIFNTIVNTLLALPLFATPVSAQITPAAYTSYGPKEVKICYQKKNMEVKASQLQKYLDKGATLGKCPKEKKER